MRLAIVENNIVVNIVKVHPDYFPILGEMVDNKKTRAGIGFTYDADRDAFIPPTPYPSWVLDEATCLWVAPIDYPANGGQYVWDEEAGDWVSADETL